MGVVWAGDWGGDGRVRGVRSCALFGNPLVLLLRFIVLGRIEWVGYGVGFVSISFSIYPSIYLAYLDLIVNINIQSNINATPTV